MRMKKNFARTNTARAVPPSLAGSHCPHLTSIDHSCWDPTRTARNGADASIGYIRRHLERPKKSCSLCTKKPPLYPQSLTQPALSCQCTPRKKTRRQGNGKTSSRGPARPTASPCLPVSLSRG